MVQAFAFYRMLFNKVENSRRYLRYFRLLAIKMSVMSSRNTFLITISPGNLILTVLYSLDTSLSYCHYIGLHSKTLYMFVLPTLESSYFNISTLFVLLVSFLYIFYKYLDNNISTVLTLR